MTGQVVLDRMEDLQEAVRLNAGTWTKRLLQITDGDVEKAALLDLAIDGNLWFMDLRFKPFAGNEELKESARNAREALNDLRERLMSIAWQQEVLDE